MKKIILLGFLAISLAFGAKMNIEIYEPNSKNFRDGFEAGIKALDFQAKTDGFQQKLITINKPYLLVFDIKKTPFHEALFLQIISAREGFDTHFTKEFVSLGEFERDIDAEDAKELMIRKYRLNPNDLKILTNQSSIVTYPFLFHNFYKNILNEAQKLGYVIKTEVAYTNKIQINTPKKTIPTKVVSKKIVFKNPRAMGYVLQGDFKSSSSFIEKGLLKATDYEFEKSITTDEGEIFVKVKGQNLYFPNSDVSIK